MKYLILSYLFLVHTRTLKGSGLFVTIHSVVSYKAITSVKLQYLQCLSSFCIAAFLFSLILFLLLSYFFQPNLKPVFSKQLYLITRESSVFSNTNCSILFCKILHLYSTLSLFCVYCKVHYIFMYLFVFLMS